MIQTTRILRVTSLWFDMFTQEQLERKRKKRKSRQNAIVMYDIMIFGIIINYWATVCDFVPLYDGHASIFFPTVGKI